MHERPRQVDVFLFSAVLLVSGLGIVTFQLLSASAVALAIVTVVRGRKRDTAARILAWSSLLVSVVAWVGAIWLWARFWESEYKQANEKYHFTWEDLVPSAVGLVLAVVVLLVGLTVKAVASRRRQR